jgi:hypothetical protein
MGRNFQTAKEKLAAYSYFHLFGYEPILNPFRFETSVVINYRIKTAKCNEEEKYCRRKTAALPRFARISGRLSGL